MKHCGITFGMQNREAVGCGASQHRHLLQNTKKIKRSLWHEQGKRLSIQEKKKKNQHALINGPKEMYLLFVLYYSYVDSKN